MMESVVEAQYSLALFFSFLFCYDWCSSIRSSLVHLGFFDDNANMCAWCPLLLVCLLREQRDLFISPDLVRSNCNRSSHSLLERQVSWLRKVILQRQEGHDMHDHSSQINLDVCLSSVWRARVVFALLRSMFDCSMALACAVLMQKKTRKKQSNGFVMSKWQRRQFVCVSFLSLSVARVACPWQVMVASDEEENGREKGNYAIRLF